MIREAEGNAVPGRFLLVQLRNMGDVLLCTPAVRVLRRAYPEARIDFLTGRLGADALSGNPHLDDVLVWPGNLTEKWRLLRELRRRRYDAVVDFQSHPRTFRIAWAAGASRRVGIRKRGPRNLAYTDLVPREHGPVYMAAQKLALLSPLDVEISQAEDLSIDIAVGAEERERVRQIWREHGLDNGQPTVAISSVVREPYKQWGAARWAEAADAMADAGANILLSSGPGERAQVEAVVRQMRHPAVWDYGPTTIPQLAAVYERCSLWVGNDGGPKFVAAAAGTPTVTVFRWKQGDAWTDWDAEVPHVLLQREPPQGCDLRCTRCKHLGCLGALSRDEVVAVALDALEKVLGKESRGDALPATPRSTAHS